MKKILPILILAAAAILACFHFRGGSFGISKEHPLGRFKALDRYLLHYKLEKHGPKSMTLPGSNITGGVTTYADQETSKETGYREDVAIIVNDKGKVLGVGGNFRFYPEDANPFEYTAVPTFMMALWHDVGAGPAKFKELGIGRFGTIREIATFDNGVLEGKWIRESPIERVRIMTKE